MEPITGLQLLKEIRADAQLKAIPFLMANARNEEVSEAQTARTSNSLDNAALASTTIWAPTDAAFAKLGDEPKGHSPEELQAMLGFHITPRGAHRRVTFRSSRSTDRPGRADDLRDANRAPHRFRPTCEHHR